LCRQGRIDGVVVVLETMGFGVAGELVGQIFPGAVESTHDRPDGNVADFGDLDVTQLLQGPEQQNDPVFRGERLDPAFDLFVELIPVDVVDVHFGPRFGMLIRHEFPGRLFFQKMASFLRVEFVEKDVVEDFEKPGFESVFTDLHVVECAVCVQEGFLDQVFGFGAVARKSKRQPKEAGKLDEDEVLKLFSAFSEQQQLGPFQ